MIDEVISAAHANRSFSELMRGVREGRSYIVTSHGRPLARIIPADRDMPATSAARNALLARLEEQTAVDVGRWTRDELYEVDR